MINNISGSQNPDATKRSSGSSLLPTLVAVAISIALGTVTNSALANSIQATADSAVPNVQARAVTGEGPDTDGDGIPNRDDLDDDNDGILDTTEGGTDKDGDGIADGDSVDSDHDGVPDVYDLDSDNDGILDNIEARLDRAAVIVLDPVGLGAMDSSIAVGSNGIADVVETSADSGVLIHAVPDTDGDGTADFRDVDSDGDGIVDVVEAGGTDYDNDKRGDKFYDGDGNGVSDVFQAEALPLYDTDGDGQLDFRDLDSDGDTIADQTESGGSSNYPTDTDQDGTADFRETDSDGDGVSDQIEVGGSGEVPTDSNSDGLPDFQDPNFVTIGDSGSDAPPQDDDPVPADNDGDGVPNTADLDDDNDSILDTEEGLVDANSDGIPDESSRDSDNDGVPDAIDLDSDNDGILDLIEGRVPFSRIAELDPLGTGSIALSFSVGVNGVADTIETSADSNSAYLPILDTDNDGKPNYLDTDSDNDGIADIIEAGGQDEDFDGRVDFFEDVDKEGFDDKLQATALPLFDTDNDGVLDYLDLDSDQDTIPDEVESGGVFVWPTDTDQDGAADYREIDSDNDGVLDVVEAGPDPLMPADSNGDTLPDFQDSMTQGSGGVDPNPTPTPTPTPGQPGTLDSDGDGIIDSEDDDDDNDGISDVIEGTGDNDSDGVPNSLDRDSDNDGIFDIRETAVDTDGDTIPDFLDLDSDNDGVYDALEAGRLFIANTGRLSSAATVDADGLAVGSSDMQLDTDGDGVVDRLDLDSDNDSLLDVLETGNPRADAEGRILPFTDANGDGADDSLPSRGTTLRDTDGDRIPDIRDLDSDQDGLSDLLEMAGPSLDQDNSGQVDNFTDANGDGLDDTVAANPTPQVDTDNDRNPNSTDLDSDNDGISDLEEAGGVDADGDDRNDLLSDADLDGIPDQNDADFTQGPDVDADGIDDTDDVDFVDGPDSDGDGVVDAEDPDSDGNGFAGPLDDGNAGDLSQGTPIVLPDTDGDGIADLNQGTALAGIIETGLGGSGFGCSIATVGSVSKPDPMLGLLLGGSLMFLGFRFKRRRIAKVAVLASTAVISGCSTLGLDMDLGRFAPDPDVNKGFYVGAGALISKLEPNTDQVAGTSVSESESAGGSLTVGYDLANRLSIEGHLADLGEAELSPAGTVGYSVGGISALYYGINDSRDRARRTGLSAYGRLGLGMLDNEVTVVEYERLNDVHLLAGVGLEYGLDNGLAVRGEFTAHETDAKYAQLGLVYRFNGSRGYSAAIPSATTQPENIPASPAPVFTPSTDAPIDTDGDGVADLIDSCPATRAGSPVKSDGCSLFDGVIEGVNFETNSDKLTAESLIVLEAVADTLAQYPDVRVTIEAHTDNLGTATSNLQLSKRRAISVARYLVDEGVSGSRLKPQAFGESQPLMSNATKKGRAANRRVEFSVIE